VTFTYDFIT